MSTPNPHIELDPKEWPRAIATVAAVQELTGEIAEHYNVPELADVIARVGRKYLELGLSMWKLDPEWADALLTEMEAFETGAGRMAGLSEAEIKEQRQDIVTVFNTIKRGAAGLRNGTKVAKVT
jgi:hypothetical protein